MPWLDLSWIRLSRSYELYESGNVSRTALYTRYIRTCQTYQVKPNNAASFGKAIKQQWSTIKVSLASRSWALATRFGVGDCMRVCHSLLPRRAGWASAEILG